MWLMLTTHLEFCIPTWYWTEPEIATLMIMSGLDGGAGLAEGDIGDLPDCHFRRAYKLKQGIN